MNGHLALLPIASGAAGLLLLSRSESSTIEKYLTPIGIYGFAATSGLFIYELYGISICKQIIKQAGLLEEKLGIPEEMGQYRDRKSKGLQRLIEAEMASWIVYVSVLAGWLYIAGVNRWWHYVPPWLIIVVAAIILGLKSAAITSPDRRRNKPSRNNAQSRLEEGEVNTTTPPGDEAKVPGARDAG